MDAYSVFTGSQNITANNNKYLRFSWEVGIGSCFVGQRWVPYAKGGEFRRWYGDIDAMIDWNKDARAHYANNSTSNLLSSDLWYLEGITYTDITSGKAHFRYLPTGCLFDKAGPSIVKLDSLLQITLGILNSSVAQYYFDIYNPTIHLQTKDVKAMPMLLTDAMKHTAGALVGDCILISRIDWDLRETSWAYGRHPLV